MPSSTPSMASALATSPALAPPIPSDTSRRTPASPADHVVALPPCHRSPAVRSAMPKASSFTSRTMPASVLPKAVTLTASAVVARAAMTSEACNACTALTMRPMITLHTLPGRFGLESLSPFCMKAEIYLKLAKLEYRAVAGDPRKAPKQKLPLIDDDGTLVSIGRASCREVGHIAVRNEY